MPDVVTTWVGDIWNKHVVQVCSYAAAINIMTLVIHVDGAKVDLQFRYHRGPKTGVGNNQTSENSFYCHDQWRTDDSIGWC